MRMMMMMMMMTALKELSDGIVKAFPLIKEASKPAAGSICHYLYIRDFTNVEVYGLFLLHLLETDETALILKEKHGLVFCGATDRRRGVDSQIAVFVGDLEVFQETSEYHEKPHFQGAWVRAVAEE
jgi:hypothetical protein